MIPVREHPRNRHVVEWHGTWRPVEVLDYDPMSPMLGPSIEMVGVEMRCGETFSATRKGLREADEHELACVVCREFKAVR